MVPGEVCTERSERGNRYREVTLNVQKSAEIIVAVSDTVKDRINRSPEYNWERRKSRWVRKTEKAAHKEIARNVKGM